MKKILFILAISWMIYPLYLSATPEAPDAERPVILVEVTKTNGGILSFLNLYRDVNFSVVGSTDEMIAAQLHCSGAGFSVCRAPRDVVITQNSLNSTESFFYSETFNNVVNSLIIQSEKNIEKGIYSGTETQKIAVSQLGTTNVYYCTATWKYNQRGDGNMSIAVYKNIVPVSGRR